MCTRTHASIHRARNTCIYIYTHICRYFFSIRPFFLYVMYSSNKKERRWRVLFSFVIYKTRKSFALRPCMTLLLSSSSSSSSSSLRQCVCIYFFISIAALAFALIVMVCTGMLLSAVVVLFLLFFVFFFDSIDARNGECSMLSLSFLLALLQSTLFAYSYVFLTLHLRVLFRCMPYVFFWSNAKE